MLTHIKYFLCLLNTRTMFSFWPVWAWLSLLVIYKEDFYLQKMPRVFVNNIRLRIVSSNKTLSFSKCLIDFSWRTLMVFTDLWSEDSVRTRKKRKGMEMNIPEKRKKPVTVSGNLIIVLKNTSMDEFIFCWRKIILGKSSSGKFFWELLFLNVTACEFQLTYCFKGYSLI